MEKRVKAAMTINIWTKNILKLSKWWVYWELNRRPWCFRSTWKYCGTNVKLISRWCGKSEWRKMIRFKYLNMRLIDDVRPHAIWKHQGISIWHVATHLPKCVSSWYNKHFLCKPWNDSIDPFSLSHTFSASSNYTIEIARDLSEAGRLVLYIIHLGSRDVAYCDSGLTKDTHWTGS